jgi:hypothetical protein
MVNAAIRVENHLRIVVRQNGAATAREGQIAWRADIGGVKDPERSIHPSWSAVEKGAQRICVAGRQPPTLPGDKLTSAVGAHGGWVPRQLCVRTQFIYYVGT